MGHGKLKKFAEMAANPLVVECPMAAVMEDAFPLRGKWGPDFFRQEAERPLTLELGCGRGEYTVGLARLHPEGNFIGVDIKGARMWTGAKEALEAGMKNVGFLRTNIEFIDRFFAPGEVSELWLTFSDPQMKKATKRLTSTYFLERYRRFMKEGGLIHLKTDSNFVPEALTRDLYGESDGPRFSEATALQTYYEGMWRDRGISIKYLRFRLPLEGTLAEPEVDIPLDEYRSYSREKRSSLETSR